ncbi:MAG: 50S ribosomal protein L6 [Clostridia bacterium]|nr:50S ribosomal protein L6 [Clostridia bacterium]MBR6641786.1 50S ribosomal protein L6 [Clostridia bacterium]
MSRIGNKAITVPAGVEVTVNGNHVVVKGPKGTLEMDAVKEMTVKVENGTVVVLRDNDEHKALHGLTRSLIANMVTGVTVGFEKKLEINGVGYRAAKQGNKLALTLGYSHPVEVEDTATVKTEVPDPNTILVKGIDKQEVGEFAAKIREYRLPEPYKGKGIKYADERIIRKEGKAGGKK